MTIEAGEYSEWLSGFLSTMEGKSSGDVPCGSCVGCCTSSKFILVRPTDKKAKAVIPKELLFPVPGLPKGFLIMGYGENGHCPMFKDNKCTIYSSRPETCRQYDCRTLAATGASTEEESEAISNRIAAWEFSYGSTESKNQAQAVKEAFAFLKSRSELFPEGYLPNTDSQLSAIAARIHKEFLEETEFSVEAKVESITRKYPVG